MSDAQTGLKARLSETMKTALKAGEKETLAFARNLHSAIRKREIDDRKDLDDAEVMKIVTSSLKQRQDSLDQFRKGGREDLAVKEEAEIKFLQSYLPAQLGDEELKQIVQASIAEAQAVGPKDMGKLMKVLMPKVQGKADGKLVNQIVKERLDKTT